MDLGRRKKKELGGRGGMVLDPTTLFNMERQIKILGVSLVSGSAYL